MTALALAMRLGYVETRPAPQILAGDSLEYHAYAVSLAHDGRYAGPDGSRAARMPGYPVFLAAVYRILGPQPARALRVQCLLGTLTCALIWIATAQFFPAPWALFCGFSAALYFGLIAPCGCLLSECLYSFLLACFLATLYRDHWKPSSRAFFGGLILGLTSLVRAEIFPWAVLTLALLPWWMTRFRKIEVAVAFCGFFLAAGPWTLRNYAIFHRFMPASSVGKFNLYAGLRWPLERQSADLGPIYAPPPNTPELERDALYGKEFSALFSRLAWKRIAGAYAFNFLTLFYPFLPQYDATFALLAPFWVFGFWAARRRKELWPLCLLIAFSIGVYTFFGGPVSRYRQGFSPFLIVLAAAGMQDLKQSVSDAQWSLGIGGWLAANLTIWGAAGPLRAILLRLRDMLW